jgi:hypothetical protein
MLSEDYGLCLNDACKERAWFEINFRYYIERAAYENQRSHSAVA